MGPCGKRGRDGPVGPPGKVGPIGPQGTPAKCHGGYGGGGDDYAAVDDYDEDRKPSKKY